MSASYKSKFETIARVASVALGFSIPLSNALMNVCVVVLIFSWCFSVIKSKLQRLATSKTTWAILVLLLVYVIGTTYSLGNAGEIKVVLKKMSRLLLIPIIMSLFTDAKWRRYALYSFWWAIGISLLVIIIKHFVSQESLINLFIKLHIIKIPTWIGSATVAFKDRIFTSLFFSFAIYSLLHYVVIGIDFTKNHHIFGKKYGLPTKGTILILIFTMACFIYLYCYCDGRSGHFIGVALISFFILQVVNSWKKKIVYNLLLYGLIFSMLGLSADNRGRYILSSKEIKAYKFHSVQPIMAVEQDPAILPLENQATGLRLEFANKSLKLVKKAPWFGHGTGSFSNAYDNYYPLYDTNNNKVKVPNPHNQYAFTLVELGSVGFLILLSLFFTMFYESIFLPRVEKYLMQGLLFSIFAGCLANSWLLDFSSMHYFIYFSGVLLAAAPTNNRDFGKKAKK